MRARSARKAASRDQLADELLTLADYALFVGPASPIEQVVNVPKQGCVFRLVATGFVTKSTDGRPQLPINGQHRVSIARME
jgi:hypothetical protein